MMAKYDGRIQRTGSQFVEAPAKKQNSPAPDVKKGGDLRAGRVKTKG